MHAQCAGHFFLKSPITPHKSNGRPPKSTKHLVSWQILICQSSLDVWNNRGQNSLGKRGRIRFYLLLPGKSVRTYGRTYGDVITKFCRTGSLPNFITHSAPLSTPLDTIVTTDTLTVNNLSFNNKYYVYLQRHESARMQLSSRSLSRQIRNWINCSNLLLTSECISRKSLLTAKKHPLWKFTCSKLFCLHLLHLCIVESPRIGWTPKVYLTSPLSF